MLPAKRVKVLRVLYVEAFFIWFLGFIITGILGVSLLVDSYQIASSSSSSSTLIIVFYCMLAVVLTVSIISIG